MQHRARERPRLQRGALRDLDRPVAEVGEGRAVLHDRRDALEVALARAHAHSRRSQQIAARERRDRDPGEEVRPQARLQLWARIHALHDARVQTQPGGEREAAAVDEPDVHLELWVREPLQILERPLGWQNLERDTVAHEDLTVLLGGGLANAALGTTRDHDGVGRRGTHEVDGDPDRDHTHQEDRAQRRREIAPRNALDAPRNAQRNAQRADFSGVALLRHQQSPSGVAKKLAATSRVHRSSACGPGVWPAGSMAGPS